MHYVKFYLHSAIEILLCGLEYYRGVLCLPPRLPLALASRADGAGVTHMGLDRGGPGGAEGKDLPVSAWLP